jgi:hypothetical protein
LVLPVEPKEAWEVVAALERHGVAEEQAALRLKAVPAVVELGLLKLQGMLHKTDKSEHPAQQPSYTRGTGCRPASLHQLLQPLEVAAQARVAQKTEPGEQAEEELPSE